MTEPSQIEEMKRYLFHEMPEKERETLEERLFENSDYFYELVELENDLIDSYARGKLDGKDRERLERSLAEMPERRAKIANARALQTLIAEEKNVSAPVAASTLWERISNFFNLKMSALQYATGAVAILLACATGFLLYQNWQERQEFAELQNRRQAELAEKEKLLQEQITELESLKRRFENERGQNEILNEKIEEIDNQKQQLEQQLKNIRRGNNQPDNKNTEPIAPPTQTLASVFLLPGGGRGGAITQVPIKQSVRSINFSLQVPPESAAETFSVRLNGNPVAQNLKPRKTASGRRILRVTIAAQQLRETDNTLTVTGDDGKEDSYLFRLEKQ